MAQGAAKKLGGQRWRAEKQNEKTAHLPAPASIVKCEKVKSKYQIFFKPSTLTYSNFAIPYATWMHSILFESSCNFKMA